MNWNKFLVVEQIDQKLEKLPTKQNIPIFREGWIRTLRKALGMSSRTLGERIGVSQPQIAKLEHSEASKSITLRSLERAAEGLNCELVYFFVPKEGSLAQTLESQARKKVEAEMSLINAHMVLEEQGLYSENQDKMIKAEVQNMLQRFPRDLWDD